MWFLLFKWLGGKKICEKVEIGLKVLICGLKVFIYFVSCIEGNMLVI